MVLNFWLLHLIDLRDLRVLVPFFDGSIFRLYATGVVNNLTRIIFTIHFLDHIHVSAIVVEIILVQEFRVTNRVFPPHIRYRNVSDFNGVLLLQL